MTTQTVGWETGFALDTDGTFDSASPHLDFLSCGIKQSVPVIPNDGIRGERSRKGDKVVLGLKTIAGQTVHNFSPVELDFILPYILGATASGQTFALGDTFNSLWALVDRKQKVYKYAGLIASKLTVTGQRGQPVKWAIDWLGKTEAEQNAGTFASSVTGAIDTGDCYVFHQAVVTLHSTTMECEEFEIVIDNAAEAQFRNSQTATAIIMKDRIVTLKVTLPYDSVNYVAYTNGAAGTWAAGSVVLTSGGESCTFSFNSLRPTAELPEISALGDELMMTLTYQAFKTGSTKELVVTNDSTP